MSAQLEKQRVIINKENHTNDMNTIIIIILLFCYSLSGLAGKRQNMVIWAKDGSKVFYNLQDKPKITFDDEHLVVTINDEEKSFSFSQMAFLNYLTSMLGDANDDGSVNVADIVELVNDILGKTSDVYVWDAADMNEDGVVNIADVILLVKEILASEVRFQAPRAARGAIQQIDLSKFTAMQLNLYVPAGVSIKDIQLAGSNKATHALMYQQHDAGNYSVVVYSMNNKTFTPVNGNLIEVEYDGEGELTTSDVMLVYPTGRYLIANHLPESTVTGMTRIDGNGSAPNDVFDLQGIKVVSKGELLKRLPKGVYLMNGKKVIK